MIEHHAVAKGEEQGATPIVELQIGIVVKDVIGALLVECQAGLVVLVDAIVLDVVARFDAGHHLQPLDGRNGRVEFDEPDGLVVAVVDYTMLVVADGELLERIVFA